MLSSCPGIRVLALAVAICSAGFVAQAQERMKHVLIVNPNTSEQLASTIITRTLSGRLGQALNGKAEIFTEFLDVSRFSGNVHRQRIGAFLSEKYATIPLDVVVAVGPEALRFAIVNRASVGRGAPLVFCCVSPATLAGIELPKDAGGLVSEYDLGKTLSLAALLQPRARTVVVVAGASAFDRQWAETAKHQLAPYTSRYEFTYLVGLPFNELLDRLRTLSPDTIVIVTTIFTDGAGRIFAASRDAVPNITAASSAPVYAPYDLYMDRGIVGGYMDTIEGAGAALADLALKAMSGGKAEVQSGLTGSYRVDWRQLRRWGLSEAVLPPGTSVLFKDPSFWDRYYDVALATLAAFALQTAIVAFLLIERCRRVLAEHSLRESEERMGSAAAAVNVGLWQYDVSGDRLWTTDHCGVMFGVPDGAPLTRETLFAAVHPEDQPQAQRWLRGASRSSTPMVGEFRVVPRDGEVRWYLSRAMTRFDDKGNPVSISGAFSDITARKAAEGEADVQRQTLAHITRVSTLGELSGAITHEINQPLTAILANAEAARRMLGFQPPPLPEIADALDDIIREDNRADDVVRRLRAMLKKGERKAETIVLNDLMKSTLRLLRSELIGRRVNVRLDLANDLPMLSGDTVQIQQVLTNLLMNAIDAVTSPDALQRRITVKTAVARPGYVEAAIFDHGPGLTAEQQRRVLEPFFSTKEHGLGLGLAICNSIVNAHGGVLSVSNDVEGGVRAGFTLPIAPAPETVG